MSVLYCEARNA
nr:unnamed protein product [Callosobruchus chinensis]